jgi:peroxiredoxin
MARKIPLVPRFAAVAAACLVFVLAAPAAATLQKLQSGMEIPDLPLRTVSGESRPLAGFCGEKLTVVVVWSTWDARSEKVLAAMQKLYRTYGGRGLVVVAVNADGQSRSGGALSKVRAAAERLKLTFPVLVDDDLALFHELGVTALPTTIITDAKRVIRYELSGYPLVGSGEMTDFIVGSMEGVRRAEAVKKGHEPRREALRFFNLGIQARKSGRMAESAETWFKKAAETDPEFVLPLVSLGKLYAQRGDAAQAEARFREALAREPGHVVALCELAMVLLNGGRTAEGEALLEMAHKADDSYTPYYYGKGLVLAGRGQPDQALGMFEASEAVPAGRSYSFAVPPGSDAPASSGSGAGDAIGAQMSVDGSVTSIT